MKRLMITELNEGAALKAGLFLHDILDIYNGYPLDSSEALSKAMESHAGQVHTLKYIRNNRHRETEVKAGPLGVVVGVTDVDLDLVERLSKMKLSTTPFVYGYNIVDSVDIVAAECAFGMNVLKDLFVGLSDVFGGNSQTLQEVLRDAKDTCFSQLKVAAAKLGANAIVGIDLDYSEFSGGGKTMLFLVASGTAVRIEKNAVMFSSNEPSQIDDSCRIYSQSNGTILSTNDKQTVGVPSSSPSPDGTAKIKCGGCGKVFSYPSRMSGKSVKCTECQHALVLP